MTAAAAARVLLIDDDPFYLRVLSAAFTDNGYTVFTAHDGIEGIRQYLDKQPDVVISDLVMPRMGGVSACMEIRRRALESGRSEPIIILLTSMIHEQPHEHEAPEMGAKYHLPKSCSALDIVILVEQLLTRHRQSTPHVALICALS